jgi:hypothetical protein
MKKNIKKIINNPWLKYLLVPIFLLILGFGFSIVLNRTIPFSIIQHPGSANNFTQYSSDKLLKGKSLKGEFIAKDNYLGILSIRFKDFIKISYHLEDVLLFRIKEQGQKDWYYTNAYRTGILHNSLFIPFGFPIIEGSKNKKYEFEIISLEGNSNNSAQISKIEPVLITSYQFPKWEIVGSKQRIINYVSKKIQTSLFSIDYILSSIVFFIPFFLYLLALIYFKYSNMFRKFVPYTMSILIIIDALYINNLYLGIYLTFLTLWIVSFIKQKEKNKFLVTFMSLFLFFSVIFTFFDRRISAQRMDLWIYTLLVIFIIQLFIEERKNIRNK